MASKNMEDIAELFKGLRFKKKLFGGVDERDVWRKLDAVQKEYRFVYELQQEIYEARLLEREEEINALKAKVPQGTAHE